jgi:hypothetical protein
MRHNKHLITMMPLFLLFSCPAYCADSPSLKGLEKIAVGILPLPPALQEIGLSSDQIRTDVELKLRMAGITVVSEGEYQADAGGLQFFATSHKNGPLVIFHISAELYQGVYLKRNPKIEFNAATLGYSYLGSVEIGYPGASTSIRSCIKDIVDRFMNAYLSENPKGGK